MTEDVYQSRAKLATRPRQQSHWNPHPTRSDHAVFRSRARDATASGPPGAPEGVYAGGRGEVPGRATFRRPYADQTRIPSLDSRLVDQPDITPDFRVLSGWLVLRQLVVALAENVGFAGTSTRPVSQGSDVRQQKCVSRGSSGSADVLSKAHEVLLAHLASMPENAI